MIKQELIKCFNNAKKLNKNYIIVSISLNDNVIEQVIENKYFDMKLEYFKEYFNDDLELKTFYTIKVSDFYFCDKLKN